MPVEIETLRRAALLFNTRSDLPKLVEELKRLNAKCLSDVPQEHRFELLVRLIEIKSEAKYRAWRLTA